MSRDNQTLTAATTSEDAPAKFDVRLAKRFSEKSVSDNTRRAYQRVVREFFSFVGDIHPFQVTPEQVLRFRDAESAGRKRPATIAFKLAVVRSFFEYLRAAGLITLNPASTKLVSPPEVQSDGAGRALTTREVSHLLAGPDRSKPEGARDYAIMLVMLRTSLRVSEVCSLKVSSITRGQGRWLIRFKVKGGRERTLPLPAEVKKVVDEYLALDQHRRSVLLSDGEESFLFQPHTNYRTLEFDKPLSTRMVWNIVSRWADYGAIGKVSPHDLRRTAITKALDQGLSYRQVQMMSGHKDPKTVMRYDHGRENLDLNAVNFLNYEEA